MADNGGEVPLWKIGLTGRCPACGKGPLFQGFLDVQPECIQCGLDYSKVDSGDGPAVFIILIVGFLIVGGALYVEVTYQPPYWLHLVIWLPSTLIISLGLLRPLKATLIALAYRHKRL
jgi:uncharacterized protein (DUF983 family)